MTCIFIGFIAILFTTKSIHNTSSSNTKTSINTIGNAIVVLEKTHYTSFLITDVETDSITLIPNEFSYSNMSSLDIIKAKDFIEDKTFKIHKDSIKTTVKGYRVKKIVIGQ